MSINIKKQETYIPVIVGDVELKFHYTDDSMMEVRKTLLETQKEIGAIEGKEWGEKEVEEAKAVLVDAMDAMFGEGAFDALYKMSPSVIVVLDYFRLMVDGIVEELNKKGLGNPDAKRAEKYLAKG